MTQDAQNISTVRGALAESSGDADRPWRRVILQATDDAGDSVEVRAADVAAIRAELKDAKPQAVAIPGAGDFTVLRPDADPHTPLAGQVAMVTGAAGAIGAGICTALLEKGAHLVITDLAGEKFQQFVDEYSGDWPGRILGVAMDVTDAGSVSAAFDEAANVWGGVDIVIVNAGVAMVATLEAMDIEQFRKVQEVNATGAMLTLAEAGRRLRAQGTGGDIVVISTKNVFMPGAGFGAYSATKAACHQLARIASQEFADADIRVNMVSPDAIFSEGRHRSGLWAEVGPGRMKARGLDEAGLEEYYRNRNLLKAKVTGRHVASAMLFFITRQTPTTGATIPVDGGLPDSTPR